MLNVMVVVSARPHRRVAQRSSRQRAGVAALAMMFAVAQWSALHHEATEQHVECAEHGERGHAASIDLERGEWTELHRSHEHASPDVRSGLGRLDHEHEHCWVATSSRESAEVVQTRECTNGPVHPGPTGEAASSPLVESIALLREAPKTSPPV